MKSYKILYLKAYSSKSGLLSSVILKASSYFQSSIFAESPLKRMEGTSKFL